MFEKIDRPLVHGADWVGEKLQRRWTLPYILMNLSNAGVVLVGAYLVLMVFYSGTLLVKETKSSSEWVGLAFFPLIFWVWGQSLRRRLASSKKHYMAAEKWEENETVRKIYAALAVMHRDHMGGFRLTIMGFMLVLFALVSPIVTLAWEGDTGDWAMVFLALVSVLDVVSGYAECVTPSSGSSSRRRSSALAPAPSRV